MNKLALKLPGGYNVDSPPGLETARFSNLSGFVSQLYIVVIYVSLFLAFYYFVWGAFDYIMAQGQKEGIAKAKEKIRWAIIGLIVVLLSFTLAKFLSEVFPPVAGHLPF